MTLTEEQRGTVAFDLEKARASIAHYRIENPSNVDTESALKELVDQANLAEDALAEIERLREENEELNESLTAAYMIGCHKKEQEMAARIKELERALVDERARHNANEEGFSWPYLARKEPDLQEEYRFIARQELQEEGKIGPDAETGNRDHVVGPDQMVPNGKVWQITEERKAAIDRGLQFLEWSYAKNSAHDTKEQIAVLRAMLDEDTHGKP